MLINKLSVSIWIILIITLHWTHNAILIFGLLREHGIINVSSFIQNEIFKCEFEGIRLLYLKGLKVNIIYLKLKGIKRWINVNLMSVSQYAIM